MAGVKGRSGGYRENATGGARPGAGRPKKARIEPESAQTADETVAERKDPLDFLEDVMNDKAAPISQRVRAAIAAAQYRHTKLHDGGKKEAAGKKAEKAAKGRFAVRPAPLKVVGGRNG